MLLYLSICACISLIIQCLVRRYARAALIAFVACLAVPHVVGFIKTNDARRLIPGLATVVFTAQYALPLILGIGFGVQCMRRMMAKAGSAKLAAPHCRCCSYDLTGNTSGICPECGTPVPEDVREVLKRATNMNVS